VCGEEFCVFGRTGEWAQLAKLDNFKKFLGNDWKTSSLSKVRL
jgi:hypothetical protein